ncbi:MAG TPA: DUF3754 domain-containing protein [Gammaproteobacteria bacterium]|nr:DUF3754 domain-containing protein [Gammaproteobacteria bacterium]
MNKITDNRYHFIPYRKCDIIEMCLQENPLVGQEKDFRQLCSMLGGIFHFEFYQVIESMKDAYAAIDPDADTFAYKNVECSTDISFPEVLGGLLKKANYEQVTQVDLDQAMKEHSMFKIRLQVDFDDFSEVLLFCRGVSIRAEKVKTWMGLRSESIEFTNYDRVVVYIRFKENYDQSKNPMPCCKPGATLLKLFQNVPKADLEMLFPNTRVRMRMVDKLLIGIPAIVSGGIVLTTKLGASLVLLGSLFGFWFGISNQAVELNKTTAMVLLAGIAALGGYLWKQFNNFKNRKLRFMQTLTQNLYFKNLDNNAGVFYRIADDAEEEECKESILAYYFLSISDEPLTKIALDKIIEEWFVVKWGRAIDFEIDDALHKLLALGLVNVSDNKFTAVSPEQGVSKLDQRWDDYFTC